jgi:hypothetical protein
LETDEHCSSAAMIQSAGGAFSLNRRCIGPTGSIDLTATAVTQRAGAGTFHTQFSKITQPKIQATCSQIVASICAGVLATFKPAANEFQS